MKPNTIKHAAVIGLVSLSSFLPLAGTQAQTTVLDMTGAATETSSYGAFYSSGGGTETSTMASGFTTGSADSVLDSITLDFDNGNFGSGFTLSLYTDNGSAQPGTLLETLTGNAAPSSGLVTYTSAGTALAANTTYWWVSAPTPSVNSAFSIDQAEVSGGTTAQGWTFDSTMQENVMVGGGLGNYDSGWINAGPSAQYSIDATITSAPEPSTMALSALGGLGALIMYRRAANAVR